MASGWEQKEDMPTARAFAATCEMDGKICVMGGATDFFEATSAAEMYDPAVAWLSQNKPNPFSAQTAIPYSLQRASDVYIQVFDLNGRMVATLWEGRQGPGEHTAVWDAGGLPAGVYLYRLKMDEGMLTGKCVLQQ